MIKVDITGVKELDAVLAGLEVNLQKRAARFATRKVAKIVADEAMREAPSKTGALRQSIVVARQQRDRKFQKAEVGYSVTVGQGFYKGDQFYAGMLEFGTKDRYHKIRFSWSTGFTGARKFVGRIDPNKHSYIRKALYSNREAKNQVFISEIRRWIANLRKRQAKAAEAGGN